MAYLAGTIVNAVRDLVPDQVYNDAGVAQPDADSALFRAQTLYRWLDDGVRLMVAASGYTLTDWWAMATAANQPIYSVSPNFLLVDEAYHKQLRLTMVSHPDIGSIYPGRGTEAQATDGYIHRITDHVELGLKPVPSAADPATTLNGGITASDTSITVTSSAGFLPYGYVLIESELIQYQSISGNILQACTRGAGGTTAAAHLTATAVTHLSVWVKGTRVPATISSSVSVVEIPLPWVSMLNNYLLGQCRISEQEGAEAQRHLGIFDKFCEKLQSQFSGKDPYVMRQGNDRRADNGTRLPAPERREQPASPLAGLVGGAG